jgi:predicted metal-dependent hydrolase
MVKARSPPKSTGVHLSAAIVMPRWAYNPGKERAPDREPLESAKQLVPLRFASFVPADNGAFRYGLALHDRGFFWEAHEIWEAVWKAAPMNGRDRIALRALIQIANAGFKQRQARPRAASRLIDEATALLNELVARGVAAERESVAARLRADRLREELGNETIPGPIRLTRFFSGEKMKENA